MKFCGWTLFKICEAGFDCKSRTLTHFIAFEEHFGGQVSRKTSARREVPCWRLYTAILGVYEENQLQFSNSIKNKGYCQSIEQRNISFQNDISLKAMRLGVLWWEKLKIHERQGRIVSLDQLMGVGEQLLLIFSSCLLAGRVKKLQMFINFCLKVDYSANLNHSKSTWRHYLSSCEMFKIVTDIKSSVPRNQEIKAAVILITLCLTSWHYVIAWNSKWRRIWHKYVTCNQRNVKNLAESASTCFLAMLRNW